MRRLEDVANSLTKAIEYATRSEADRYIKTRENVHDLVMEHTEKPINRAEAAWRAITERDDYRRSVFDSLFSSVRDHVYITRKRMRSTRFFDDKSTKTAVEDVRKLHKKMEEHLQFLRKHHTGSVGPVDLFEKVTEDVEMLVTKVT